MSALLCLRGPVDIDFADAAYVPVVADRAAVRRAAVRDFGDRDVARHTVPR